MNVERSKLETQSSTLQAISLVLIAEGWQPKAEIRTLKDEEVDPKKKTEI